MSKPDHLLRHLQSQCFRDPLAAVDPCFDSQRLSYFYGGNDGNWKTVAEYISGLRRWPVTWFPDANIAFRQDTDVIWEALRIAALGSPHGSTVITGVIEAEMQDWLTTPRHHLERAGAIRAAMDGETWIRKYRIPASGSLRAAMYNYTYLLGFRRLLARPCADGVTMVGTSAVDKTETLNAIRNKIGERAEGLAKKR